MRILNGAIATCLFELKRSMTFQRLLVFCVLALFPPLMFSLLILGPRAFNGQEVPFVEMVVTFLVSLVCMLSLLLWATPNVYSELEGKSWMFISSRPKGRISLFLGKYLAAVISSFAVSFVALSMCVLIASRLVVLQDPLNLWLALNGVFLIACFVYGGIFAAIGTLFYKRSMVIAAGYFIVSEIFIGFLPATLLTQFSPRFHLVEIGVDWIGWFIPVDQKAWEILYGNASTNFHIACLSIGVVVAISVGCYTIVTRQYITADET